MLAFLKQAEGDFVSSSDFLSKANNIRDNVSIRQSNITDQPSLDQLGIMLSRVRPDMAYLLTDAVLRVNKQGLQPDDEVDFTSSVGYRYESDYTDMVRVLIELDRADEALPLLERLLGAAKFMGRQGDAIRYLILKAMAFHALEDQVSAILSLGQALTLARPEGYVRIFVDEGKFMAVLLTLAVRRNIEPDYAAELLAAFPEGVQQVVELDMEMVTISQPLVEPLSERELEVLRLMADGLKYKEVAERMVISVNTVRHHTRNIYGKLLVSSRAQAIARARELNLL
jgi:LuxR family maltose regulon positive regulatory protein